MQPIKPETQEMVIKRYKELVTEFTQLAMSPSWETEQRYKAVQRNLNSLRELLLKNGVTLEEEAQA